MTAGFCFASDSVPDSSASDLSVPDSYLGYYIGAGLNYQHTIAEAKLDDNLDSVLENAGLNEAALKRMGISVEDANSFILAKSRPGLIGGTVVAGYGTKIDNNYYVGAELYVDMTEGKNNSQSHILYKQSKLQTSGIIPTVAVRFGRFFSSIGCLMYTRLGLSHLHTQFQNEDFNSNKNYHYRIISPAVGLGVEKAMSDQCSTRFECDYRFSSHKKRRFTDASYSGPVSNGQLLSIPGYDGTVKNKVRGYAVRLIGVYHL